MRHCAAFITGVEKYKKVKRAFERAQAHPVDSVAHRATGAKREKHNDHHPKSLPFVAYFALVGNHRSRLCIDVDRA